MKTYFLPAAIAPLIVILCMAAPRVSVAQAPPGQDACLKIAKQLDSVNGPQDQAQFLQLDAALRNGNCMVYKGIFDTRQRALNRMIQTGAQTQQKQNQDAAQNACEQSVVRAEGMAAKAEHINWKAPVPGGDRTTHPLEALDKEVASLLDKHCDQDPQLKTRVARVQQTLDGQIALAKASNHDLGYSAAQAAATKSQTGEKPDPAQCKQTLGVLEQQLQTVDALPPGMPVFQIQLLTTLEGTLESKHCDGVSELHGRVVTASAKVKALSARSTGR